MKKEYFIGIKNKNKGPFTLEDLKTLSVNGDTLIWKEGLLNWTKASELEELKDVITPPLPIKIIPPPLPLVMKDGENSEVKYNDEQHLKRDILKLSFLRKRDKVLSVIKSNFRLSLLTIPIALFLYVLMAYSEGGFVAIKLSREYKQFEGLPKSVAPNIPNKTQKQTDSLLNYYKNNLMSPDKIRQANIPRKIDSLRKKSQIKTDSALFAYYDHLSPDKKKQGSIENSIDSLMNAHENENELSPSTYESLKQSHLELDSLQSGVTYGFKEGTVVLDYNQFLNDRINIAFGMPTILKAISIFILSNLLIFGYKLYRSKFSTA